MGLWVSNHSRCCDAGSSGLCSQHPEKKACWWDSGDSSHFCFPEHTCQGESSKWHELSLLLMSVSLPYFWHLMLSSSGICRKNGQRIYTSHVCAMEEQFHEHVGSEPWRRQKEAVCRALWFRNCFSQSILLGLRFFMVIEGLSRTQELSDDAFCRSDIGDILFPYWHVKMQVDKRAKDLGGLHIWILVLVCIGSSRQSVDCGPW